jgi:hypothetical protein
MILQRVLEAVVSALKWLLDLLFPHVVLISILLCLGLGALVLLVAARSRARALAQPRVADRDRP